MCWIELDDNRLINCINIVDIKLRYCKIEKDYIGIMFTLVDGRSHYIQASSEYDLGTFYDSIVEYLSSSPSKVLSYSLSE